MREFVPNVGCDPGHVDVVQRRVDLILQSNDGKQTQTHREVNEWAARCQFHTHRSCLICWSFFTDEHEERRWLERVDGEEQRECRDGLLATTQLAHGAEALHRRHRSVLDACTQTRQAKKA